MKTIWPVLLLASLEFCLANNNYIQPNYTARPISRDENTELWKKCGQKAFFERSPVQLKVMNGENVERTDAPWIVSIVYAKKWMPNMTIEDLYNSAEAGGCTGNLISPRHVVTAAHCILKSLHRMLIVVHQKCSGNNNLKECSEKPILIRQTFKAYQSIVYQEKPKGTVNSYGDVGIYELTEDVPFSASLFPICLGDYQLDIGETVDFWGFGKDGTSSPTFMLAHMQMNVKQCVHAAENKYKIDMMCADAKYQEQCKGDSGGGLVHTRHGSSSIFAVTSFGELCTVMNERNVFGKDSYYDYMTDIRPHLYWICGATGVCANKNVIDDVDAWNALPNRHRERYRTFSALDEYEIYV